MNMKTSLRSTIILSLLMSGSAFAQTQVEVGPNGVKVKTDGADVDVGDHGVQVRTEGTETEVGDAVEVKTKGKTLKRGAQNKAFVCEANQELRLENKVLKVKGDGVVAKGNCELVIVDCEIIASGAGIRASGNATVKLVNSKVRGKKAGLHISGNATVTSNQSKVKGRVVKKGNGDFEKED